MPSINLQILPQHGPVVDVHIGVSEPKRIALIAAGQPVPPPESCRLLIDTGASLTCIDSWVIQQLGLSPTGAASFHTPSTSAGNAHSCNQYDVFLSIQHPVLARMFHATPVFESAFKHQGIDGLLGRDILQHCLFIYNGELGICTLSF